MQYDVVRGMAGRVQGFEGCSLDREFLAIGDRNDRFSEAGVGGISSGKFENRTGGLEMKLKERNGIKLVS